MNHQKIKSLSVNELEKLFSDEKITKQNSNIIKLNMTKKALAERIGVQRTSLSRELAKMREDGLIEFTPVSISLLYKFFK